MNAPKRPAIRYYGSKWLLAPWIESYLPPHEHRVIPFAGSLSDTLRWRVPELETVSDLDGRVLNFFKVLRERPLELIRAIKLTPWHEAEYRRAQQIATDSLEDARRFWSLCWMSVQGGPNPGKSGFRFMKSREKRFSITPGDGMNINHLYDVAERLKRIQFLNQDARDVMARFINEPNTLIYLDPPYLPQTRAQTTGYTHDNDATLHHDISELAHQQAGYVIISGYAHPLYTELYENHGWSRVDKSASVNGGGKKIESLWLSPRTWQALQKHQATQPKLQLNQLSIEAIMPNSSRITHHASPEEPCT